MEAPFELHKCTKCAQLLLSSFEARKHAFTHMTDCTLCCDVCDFMSDSELKINQHINTHDPQAKMTYLIKLSDLDNAERTSIECFPDMHVDLHQFFNKYRERAGSQLGNKQQHTGQKNPRLDADRQQEASREENAVAKMNEEGMNLQQENVVKPGENGQLKAVEKEDPFKNFIYDPRAVPIEISDESMVESPPLQSTLDPQAVAFTPPTVSTAAVERSRVEQSSPIELIRQPPLDPPAASFTPSTLPVVDTASSSLGQRAELQVQREISREAPTDAPSLTHARAVENLTSESLEQVLVGQRSGNDEDKITDDEAQAIREACTRLKATLGEKEREEEMMYTKLGEQQMQMEELRKLIAMEKAKRRVIKRN
ncbi:unnamed protein product, partial [Mesorhabditis belari]|uniref:C2H2-type domain-containing protein n=1 Tax=Mesorhabditis belari TaxID=2138241 RepID=A0AAF3EXM0_9BILA